MFPQLIAGPIVRYVDIQEQLESRVISWHKAGVGAEYFIKGLAKKGASGQYGGSRVYINPGTGRGISDGSYFLDRNPVLHDADLF